MVPSDASWAAQSKLCESDSLDCSGFGRVDDSQGSRLVEPLVDLAIERPHVEHTIQRSHV